MNKAIQEFAQEYYTIFRKIALFVTSMAIGLLIIYQYQSHEKYRDIIEGRDPGTSLYNEINLLIRNNQNLKDEVDVLREHLNEYSSQEQAINALREQVERNEKIAGIQDLKGPGAKIRMEKTIELYWVIDLLNEAINAGAEAMSLNGIRFVLRTEGLSISGDQFMMNGVLLQPPYVIELIGDGEILEKALTQPGGIVTRLQMQYPDFNIGLERKAMVFMKKVI